MDLRWDKDQRTNCGTAQGFGFPWQKSPRNFSRRLRARRGASLRRLRTRSHHRHGNFFVCSRRAAAGGRHRRAASRARGVAAKVTPAARGRCEALMPSWRGGFLLVGRAEEKRSRRSGEGLNEVSGGGDALGDQRPSGRRSQAPDLRQAAPPFRDVCAGDYSTTQPITSIKSSTSRGLPAPL
jgi:hypothetical protein